MRVQLISPAVADTTSRGYYERSAELRARPPPMTPLSPRLQVLSDTAVSPRASALMTPTPTRYYRDSLAEGIEEQVAYLKKENEALIERLSHVSDITKQHDILVDERREMEHTYHRQVSQTNDLERSRDSLVFELERRTERCTHLEEEVTRQHSTAKRLETEIDNLDKHLLEEREINKRQAFQLKELQRELNRAVDDLHHMHSRVKAASPEPDHAQELKKALLVNDQLKLELEQSARDKAAADAKVRELTRELAELNRHKGKFDSILADAEKKIDEGAAMAIENQVLKACIKELEDDGEKKTKDIANTLTADAAKEALIQRLQVDLKVAQEALADLEQSFHGSSSNANTLKTELSEALQGMTRYEKELKSALEAKHDLVIEVENMKYEINRLQGEKEAAMSQTKKMLLTAEEEDMKRQQAERDLRDMHIHTQSRQSLNNAKEWEAVRAVLEKRLSSWAQDNEALQHQLTLVRRERDTAKDALLALQQEMSTQRSIERSHKQYTLTDRWQQRPLM